MSRISNLVESGNDRVETTRAISYDIYYYCTSRSAGADYSKAKFIVGPSL